MLTPRRPRKPQPGGRQVNSRHPIAAGLSGYWLLDDPGDATNGGTQWDLTRRFNGSHFGGADTITSIHGRALQLNGTTGRIKIPNFLLRPNGTGVSLWCRAWSNAWTTQNGMLIEKSTVNAAYELFVSGNHIFLRGASGANQVSSAATLTDGAWYDLLGTIDGSGNGILYINGVLDNAGSIAAPSDPAGDLYIGVYDDSGFPFSGIIAWAAVWNRVLSAAEAAKLWTDPYCLIAPKPFILAGVVAGGTTFTLNVGGSITPAGALVKQANKAVAGSSTPAGALGKLAACVRTALITPGGSVAKQANKLLVGSTTPVGSESNVKVLLRSFAGSTTPAGALTRQTQKGVGGSATPAGALARACGRLFGGSTTPAGALSKSASKPLVGSVSPSATLAAVRTFIRSMAGSVTPAGAVARSTAKGLGGTATPAGAVARASSKSVAGTVTPTGTVRKLIARATSGVLGLVGNVVTALVGVITPQVIRLEARSSTLIALEARSSSFISLQGRV